MVDQSGCAWLGASLIAIIFPELATPQFLMEYDSRPNRLFVEYPVYPREVTAHAVERLSRSVAAYGCRRCRTTWVIARHFKQYAREASDWRKRTVLLLWPLVVVVLFVMVRLEFQHRPARPCDLAFCDDAMVNSLVANSALGAVRGLRPEERSAIQLDVRRDAARGNGRASARRDGGTARRFHFQRVADAASTGRDRAPREAAQPGHRARGEPRGWIRQAARRSAPHAESGSTGRPGHLVRSAVRDWHALGARHRSSRRGFPADGAERGENPEGTAKLQ